MIRIPAMSRALKSSLVRELLIGFRNRGDIANPLIFFLSMLVFIPLGISPDAAVLASIAPGMIWVIALLATLLSLDRLFMGDFEDGSLEQMLLSGQPMYLLVLSKVLVHWLMTGLPLTLLSPLLAGLMFLPSEAYFALFLSLFLGTAALSLIGSIGAALTVALRRGGLLLSLIVMPLYIPALILGAGIVQSSVEGFAYQGYLGLLGAYLVLCAMLAPFASAAALRVSLDA